MKDFYLNSADTQDEVVRALLQSREEGSAITPAIYYWTAYVHETHGVTLLGSAPQRFKLEITDKGLTLQDAEHAARIMNEMTTRVRKQALEEGLDQFKGTFFEESFDFTFHKFSSLFLGKDKPRETEIPELQGRGFVYDIDIDAPLPAEMADVLLMNVEHVGVYQPHTIQIVYAQGHLMLDAANRARSEEDRARLFWMPTAISESNTSTFTYRLRTSQCLPEHDPSILYTVPTHAQSRLDVEATLLRLIKGFYRAINLEQRRTQAEFLNALNNINSFSEERPLYFGPVFSTSVPPSYNPRNHPYGR